MAFGFETLEDEGLEVLAGSDEPFSSLGCVSVGCGGCGRCIVDGEVTVRWRSHRNYARPELDADGDVVRGGKAGFAETDGQGGFARAAVADADEF